MKEAEVEPAAAPEAKKDEKAAEPEAPKEEAAEKEEAPAEADGDKNTKRTLSETDGAAAEEKDGKSPKVPPRCASSPKRNSMRPAPNRHGAACASARRHAPDRPAPPADAPPVRPRAHPLV